MVETLVWLCHHKPTFVFGGLDFHDILLTEASYLQVTRDTIQAVLKKAAEGTGRPTGDYASHSLRFGGASALWAAYHDSGLVRRWGRWATDTFQTYLWEGRKGSLGVAEALAKANITPN